jgi:Peptidase family C25
MITEYSPFHSIGAVSRAQAVVLTGGSSCLSRTIVVERSSGRPSSVLAGGRADRGGKALREAPRRLLRIREQLTTFVIMNCLNGYFTDPATESLSEALMRNANGGAVAAWASSAMTFADGQVSLSQEFYRQVFGSRARLGDAAIRAKPLTFDGDVRRTWILFGDPSMRMMRMMR